MFEQKVSQPNRQLRENLTKLISRQEDKVAALLDLLCDDTDKGIDTILASLTAQQRVQLRDKLSASFKENESNTTTQESSKDDTASYLTDDRDLEEQAQLNAFWMNNGDYYLAIEWQEEGKRMISPAVRFCTSGGASSFNYRLPIAVADVFKAIRKEPTSTQSLQMERDEAYQVIQDILDKQISYHEVADFMLVKHW